MDMDELEQTEARVRNAMRANISWHYMNMAPDAQAQKSIALRVLTIKYGKIVQVDESRSLVKELRPYWGNTTPEYGTDPEVAYKIKSPSPTMGSDNIYVDLNLRLQYQIPDYPGMAHSVVVTSEAEFTVDEGFCVFFRNEGHLNCIYNNNDFRNALINEFQLGEHFIRLREEFRRLRGIAFAQSKTKAEAHGKRIEKSRARAEKPESQAKKAEKSRALAREKISTELIKGRLGESFKQFTPEQFFEMYLITRQSFYAIQEIASWQNRNPTASKEVTLEDIVQAYELAHVKDVMQS